MARDERTRIVIAPIRRGRLTPRPRTFSIAWWIQPSRLAMLMLGAVLALGTAGYVLVEGWSWWDALYMTVITVTTVGYREVQPLTLPGQIFTVALLIGGVGTVFYTVTLVVARVVEGGLHQRWEARRRDRMIDELTSHFVVCGHGRIGRIVVDEFRRNRVPHVVIDRDADRVHQIIEEGSLAVAADASAEETLRRVGIDRARALIAVAGTDAENVYIVLSARLLRPDLFIIGRAETDDARRKLQRAGADRVISPYQLGAHHIAQTALRPAVVEFVQLATASQPLELAMEQILVEAGGGLDGHTLITANLRQRFGVIVVAIQRQGGHMEFNPAPDAAMRAGDQIVVLGSPEPLKSLEQVARTGAKAGQEAGA
jgi:voltage-gated potassium channel